MALGDLELPVLVLLMQSSGCFLFEVRGPMVGWGAVTAGLLRAMADDYGALALIETLPPQANGIERVQVMLLDSGFATNKEFSLALPQPKRDALA